MSQPIQPIVRTTGVNHFFGVGDTRTQVLFDNNLEVMPGELVIMSGPSGSGKTTLLTLIGGLRTLQEGNIDIWDSALNQHRSLIGLNELGLVQVRRLIGFIFQRHNLFESLNAMQNVRMAQQLRDLAPNSNELASNLLKDLGLGERVGYKPYQLSGGQRQRVAIARALINKPKLILADEPTAALDEKSGEAVVRLLKTLAKENGTTSLIVTHDSRIMNEADRIVEMQRGHIHVNIVVAERLFIYEGLRRCAAFVSLLPNEQFAIADKISIGLHPKNAATDEHVRKHPWLEVYQPGESVIRQGDRGDKFYLIRQGEVDVLVNDANGQRNVAHLATGDFFGDRALVVDQPRNATVVAATRLEVYTISREEFQKASRTTLPFIQRIVEVYSGGPPIIVPGSRPDIELPPKSSL